MSLGVGARLGHYQVTAKLGEGGMGEVWRATDTQLNRDVALKILPEAFATDPDRLARFQREAQVLASLNHPGIAAIYGIEEDEGTRALVLELVEGPTLADRIAKGPISLDEALPIAKQIAEALEAAHEAGVIHRDLKPANIKVREDGTVKVLDFGLAKRAPSEALSQATTETYATMTQAGALLGTLPYMAPEQLRGQPADVRSDIWALGLVLYEMVVGERPFTGKTGVELSSAILHQPPAALPRRVPVSSRVVIERCLAKEPAQRYQRASEVQAAMDIQAGTALLRAVWSYGLSRRRLLGGVSAAAVVLVALVAWDVGGVRALLPGAGNTPASIRMAVLPFVNLTGDPEQEYFTDGITAEMISQLGRLNPARLGVIARTSVMRYKQTDQPIDEIGRELGVEYVLEGSALREGDRVRITAQLVQVRDQLQVWTDSYERSLASILAIQGDVAQGVAESLALTLLPDAQTRLAAVSQVNPDAYDAYQRGRAAWERLTPASFDTAMDYFELALEHDPDYALAHVGVADVWGGRMQTGVVPVADAYAVEQAALGAAFELDESLPQAHARLASIRSWQDWDWEGAEDAFRRAIDLDPTDSRVRGFYSQHLTMMRRFDEAIVQMDEAMQISPFDPLLPSLHAMNLVFMKRYEEGVELARSVLDENPNNAAAFRAYTEGLYLLGRFDELFEAARTREASGGNQEIVEALDRGYAAEGFQGAFRSVADLLAARSEQRYVSPNGMMADYIRAGDLDKAVDWAERAIEQRNPNVPFWGVDPLVDVLRDEPRFEAIIRELGFPFDR